MLIESIQSPADIKGLDTAQLTALAAEIRSGLMNRLSKRGGHFGRRTNSYLMYRINAIHIKS